MKLLFTIIASFAAAFGAATAADRAMSPVPAAPWDRVELVGMVDGPRDFQLFANGNKEFDLIVGDGVVSHFVNLAFASQDDYAIAERYDRMPVVVKGVFASRGRGQVLVVQSMELRN